MQLDKEERLLPDRADQQDQRGSVKRYVDGYTPCVLT
jgi:hypothetical protein